MSASLCQPSFQFLALLAALLALSSGCGGSSKETAGATPATTPKQAASQLQQAFGTAPPEVKGAATTASDAMQAADYARAAQALEAIKAQKNLTVEQSMAVHESEASLEMRLISAMQNGDPKAREAYEQLKRRRRN
jgi:hypothetical protein